MHWLSSKHRAEFLAVPQLARFTMAEGQAGMEATLLIKATTLMLKYFLRLKRFNLLLLRVGKESLAYGIQIADGGTEPAVLWSLLEHSDESEALRDLITKPQCVVFLFNELAVNVAWTEVNVDLSGELVRALIESSSPHQGDAVAATQVEECIDALQRSEMRAVDGQIVCLPAVTKWNAVNSHYITNRALRSKVSIFEENEGAQQEELALWLTDNLQPTGMIKSPQIGNGPNVRELSDLLLSHQYGAFLIESKTLSILARPSLPDRVKLSRDVTKHLRKATAQLVGAVKNLRRGHRITDLAGQEVQVEREQLPHVIVLVPDLALLSESEEFGGEYIKKVSRETGGFLHILDVPELMRMVQAAAAIAAKGRTTTAIMAFDFYLMERFKYAVALKTPDFGMLLRFEE